MFRDIAEMFMSIGPDKAREIRESVERGDTQALAQTAYFLKGSAGTLGVHRVQSDCRLIEAADPVDQPEELNELLDTLDRHLAEGIEALEALLSELPTSSS